MPEIDRHVAPKEPRPWTPHWWAKIGPVVHEGDGILAPEVFKQKGLLESFEAFIEPRQLRIRVDLRTGNIYFNNRLEVRPDLAPGTPLRLIWFRRMRKEVHQFDKSLTIPFETRFYGIGWQATVGGRNLKLGFMISSDGRLEPGLPENAPS
jgi:hypothetical protein